MSAAPATVRQLLQQATALLSESDTPELDAQLLLASVLDKPRSWLYAWPEHQPAVQQTEKFHELISARLQGHPVAYLLGTREFWSLPLRVTPAVLIPRPETELLVETALSLLADRAGEALAVADLGTGSGAIALALASERPAWQLYATDISEAALAVAEGNQQQLGIANLSFAQGSWCEALPETALAAIVANPPYIAEDDIHLDTGDVRFEPRSALVAAGDGLQDIACIASQSLPRLADGGWLLLEHGWQQGELVRRVLQDAGYQRVDTLQDGGGRDRITIGRKHE